MDGSPAVARDEDGFINIKFQAGPVHEHGVNGCGIEDVIYLLIRRLEGFQAGPFACEENAEALADLGRAVEWLEARTAKRTALGMEGTNLSHEGAVPLNRNPRLRSFGRRSVSRLL